MQVRDLIAALQRFDPTEEVAIEHPSKPGVIVVENVRGRMGPALVKELGVEFPDAEFEPRPAFVVLGAGHTFRGRIL